MEETLSFELEIKKSRYRHFKGGLYEIIGSAFNAEDQKPMVIYKSLQDSKVWVRPLQEFFGKVETEDYNGLRFIEEDL